jgi:hypothetical protein
VQASIDIQNDMPRPDAVGQVTAADQATALPRPLANIHDSGRIRFGSCYRMPVAR